jgi:hypothetical protein
MKLSSRLLIPLHLTLTVPAFGASMVLPVDGTNLAPTEVDAIGQMITSAYQTERQETVLPPSEVKRALDETGDRRLAAQKLGASEFVHISAVRLDQRIVIHAATHSPDGQLIHSAKITATSLDDIEPASERLARALVGKQSTRDTGTLDNITTTEARTPNRIGTERLEGFKGGVTYPIGWGERVAPMMNAGFDLRMEGPRHFIELGLGISVPAGDHDYSYGGVFADIGANLYLSQTSTAPYLGVGLMPRLMSVSPANIAPYVQGGVMFFRESKTRVYVDVKVAQNVLPVAFTTPEVFDETTSTFSSPDDDELYPTEIGLSVGIGF